MLYNIEHKYLKLNSIDTILFNKNFDKLFL